jgi:hypothetical protein
VFVRLSFSGVAGDLRGGINTFLYTVYKEQMSRSVFRCPDIFGEI